MKVLHTNMHNGWGGQANRILNLCRKHREMGVDAAIASPRGSELALRARQAGIPVFDEFTFRRGFRPLALLPDVRRMRRLLRTGQYDIVDTHGSQDTWVVSLAMRRLKHRPRFVRTRHNLFPIKPHFWNRRLYTRQVDFMIASAPEVGRKVVEEGILPEDRVRSIWSGIDTGRFFPRKPNWDLLDDLDLPKDAPLVGSVGRLAWEKGHDVLLRAAALVNRRMPDVRFVILGEGPDRADLMKLRDELELQGIVKFAGFRKDVPDLLPLLNLFVLASVSEPMGNAAAEALVTRVPVIASATGGLKDIVIDRETGLLVPPGEHEPLAKAIEYALTHPDEMTRMTERGEAHVRAHFTVEQLAEETLAVYRSLLDHP